MAKRAIIREGDATSHGGVVQEAFPAFNVYGKRAAGVGHRGFCPQCKTTFTIVSGAKDFSYMGKSVAVEGMHTSCGATLIASQWKANVDDDSYGGVDTQSNLQQGARTVHTGGPSASPYGRRFLLVDTESGQLLSNRRYAITHANGRMDRGTTDGTGHTATIEADHAAEISIHVEFVAPATRFDRSALT